MHERIAFLLGAGISIPAELPSTRTITDIILSGDGIMRHTDRTYYFGTPLYDQPDQYVPKVTIFLNRLKIECDLYYLYQYSRYTTYEEIYYIASQIEDSERFEYDNPAVQPLIDKIMPEILPIIRHRPFDRDKSWTIAELASEATNYIRDIVWNLLTKAPKKLDYLASIKNAYLDSQLTKINIFTLNHDTILEQYLAQNDIQVNDGFGAEERIRKWDTDLLMRNESKVNLIKLHGSVNWFRFRINGDDWSNEIIGIPESTDIWHTTDANGRLNRPLDGHPMMLVGTFNKMLDYSSGIYADLNYHFYRLLKETDCLIVSGYSFRDRGINSKILDWLYADEIRKIIAVHPDPANLKGSARGSVSNKWDSLLENRRLRIISQSIENTTWETIDNQLST